MNFNKDRVAEPLYCIVVYYNPFRVKARVKHVERSVKDFIDSGAVVYLIEAGFNRRELVFADSGLDGTAASCGVLGNDPKFKHRYIGLHTTGELWLKENLINVGVQHLTLDHHDWEQIAWPDADVHHARPNWVGETIQQLQHYKFVQTFSHAHDLGPNYEVLPESYHQAGGLSFVKAWREGYIKDMTDDKPTINVTGLTSDGPPEDVKVDLKTVGSDIQKLVTDFAKLKNDATNPYAGGIWPGLSWACTRQAWDVVGGLFDVGVWGGADFDSAYALIERAADRIHTGAHPNYQMLLAEWEDKCRWGIRRNIGYVEGSIFHYWHGRKKDRRYTSKRNLMCKVSFDPMRHLKKDSQGLYQLHDDGSENFIKFRDTMRQIAKERNEDTNEI